MGRAVWLALTIGLVLGAFVSPGGALLAIPAFLIFGLGIPIFLGLKRARYLALAGLVVVLVVAPLAGLVITTELFAPVGLVASAPAGVEWSVTVGGITQVSHSGSVVFQLPNGSQPYAVSPVAGFFGTNRTGTVSVAGAASAVRMDYSVVTYPVTFTESNLAHGTSWGITLGSTNRVVTTVSAVFDLANGTYAYGVDAVSGYSTPSTTGTVEVTGAPVAVPVEYDRAAYPVTFSESGLPFGTPWTLSTLFVNVTSSAPSVVLELPNGTVPFSAVSEPGLATPAGQKVVVAGAAASVTVAFAPLTYPVTFTENQLPAGTNWSVTVGGDVHHSVSSTLVADLPNGSSLYEVGSAGGYTPDVSNTSVFVNGGAAQVTIVFNRTAYPVVFTETGLVNGTVWNVTIGPTATRSTGPSIEFELPNGSASIAIGAESGYTVSVAGSVSVSGAKLEVPVRFAAVSYAVAFTETGLAAGTSWTVTINGVKESSTTSQVLFELANGTYPYSIGAVAGETPPAFSGITVVSGAAGSVPVPFSSTTYAVTFNESGLPAGSASTVLENGSVTPFHGVASTDFVWTVTVDPAFLSSTNSSPLWLDLFVSTCPGATSPNSSTCGSSYPFVLLTHYFCSDPSTVASCEATGTPLSRATLVTFVYPVSTVGVWEWQMGLAVENLSVHQPEYSLLVGDPQYNGIEGPVVGSYGQIFEVVVLYPTYLDSLLYLGLPFYVVLLLYLFLKNRERRRKEARRRAAGPIPPTSAAGAGGPGTPIPSGGPAPVTPAPPPPGEVACPNCGAVVYPSEAKCWKCGTELVSALPSEGPSPPVPPP